MPNKSIPDQMNQKFLKLQREIVRIQKPYPGDDLISCYKDFLKVRDFLPYYQFNIKVLESLIDLACASWMSAKRINRISLLIAIKRYLGNAGEIATSSFTRRKPIQLSRDTCLKLFTLFQYCFEPPGLLSEKQLEEAKAIANLLIMGISTDPTGEKWLCENVDTSELILNRVLRYPIKSKVISAWARQAAHSNNYRSRRAELTSWIIDEQPDYVIDRQTLIDDFEFLNAVDKKTIQKYETAIATNRLIESALSQNPATNPFLNFWGDGLEGESESITSYPELKLTQRFYKVPKDKKNLISYEIPDFETMRDVFYKNIDTTLKITMLWSIFYSRLTMSQKARLLKRYYSEETYLSFFKICRRLESIELWKWLKGKQQ